MIGYEWGNDFKHKMLITNKIMFFNTPFDFFSKKYLSRSSSWGALVKSPESDCRVTKINKAICSFELILRGEGHSLQDFRFSY